MIRSFENGVSTSIEIEKSQKTFLGSRKVMFCSLGEFRENWDGVLVAKRHSRALGVDNVVPGVGSD